MQLKPITAIVVLSLVVASLLVSGCTSSTSPTAAPTVKATVVATATPAAKSTAAPTAAPTATADGRTFLEKFTDSYKTSRLSGDQGNIQKHTVDIEWLNASPPIKSVRVIENWYVDGVLHVYSASVAKYGNVKNATESYNIWTADRVDDGHGFWWGKDAYVVAAGHQPTVAKMFGWHDSESKYSKPGDHVYLQYDDVFIILAVSKPS